MHVIRYFILGISLFSCNLMANETEVSTTKGAGDTTVFQFTAKVSREIEKDLMIVNLFSEKEGKSLSALKKSVSADLNDVIEKARKVDSIEVVAQGIANNITHSNSGKISGWRAFGSVMLKSTDIDALSKIIENLGENIAIQSINFTLSPEREAQLQDEMTQAVIKQFQHHAEVIKNSLNAKDYIVKNVQLDEPFRDSYQYRSVPMAASFKMEKRDESLPLEAGKEVLSLSATGAIVIKQ